MTKEDGLELKKARIAAKVTLMVVAERCFTSDRTVARWEDGEVTPSPDDLDRFSQAVGDPHLWHRMMRRLHDSYARHYPVKPVDNELPVSLLRSRYEMEDVLALHAEIERDSIDGKIEQAAPSAEIIRLRDGYERLIREFDTVMALLGEAAAADEGAGRKYAAAIRKALDKIAGRLDGIKVMDTMYALGVYDSVQEAIQAQQKADSKIREMFMTWWAGEHMKGQG